MGDRETRSVVERPGAVAAAGETPMERLAVARELLRPPEAVTLAPPDAGRLLSQVRPGPTEVALGSVPGMFALLTLPPLVIAAQLPEIALAAPAMAVLGTIARAADRLFRARRGRVQLDRSSVSETLQHVAAGSVVRVRGAVAKGDTFVSPSSKRRVVLAEYRGTTEQVPSWTGSKPVMTETRGIDFDVTVGVGERLRVSVEGPVVFVDALPRVFARVRPRSLYVRSVPLSTTNGVFCSIDEEGVLAPGDTVDLLGTIEHVIDATAERGGTRALPLVAVVRGTAEQPLLVRRVKAEGGAPP